MLSSVNKFILPFIGTVIMGVLSTYVAIQDKLSTASITFIVITLALAAINAASTYGANKTDSIWTSAKFWLNIGHVALQSVAAIIGTTLGLGDVSVIQWAGVGMAILSALGVAVVPNARVFNLAPIATVHSEDGNPAPIVVTDNSGVATQ